MAAVVTSAFGGMAHPERMFPMRFTWYVCEPNCGRWIGAVGTVTGDTLKGFNEFTGGRDLRDATVVLDSAGGSVNDTIALGTKWRQIGLRTTVGTVTAMGGRLAVRPEAWCESMCVFLLLSGKVRYVPGEAHVRVHQIWMGNRAETAEAGTYDAQDVTIVERDIGRLAKYVFDMGGTGELLSLSLDVAPWETLRELSPQELRATNVVNTIAVADVLPDARVPVQALASPKLKPAQDRHVGTADSAKIPPAHGSTRSVTAASSAHRMSPTK